MTKEPMTTEAQITYLAERVMRWDCKDFDIRDMSIVCKHKDVHDFPNQWVQFRPTEDWNHWRQVEEKVIDDEGELFTRYCVQIAKGSYLQAPVSALRHQMCLNLPTRCAALIAAHKELYPSSSSN